MLFRTVLVNAFHASFENRIVALNRQSKDEYVRYWNEATGETRPDGKPLVVTTNITTNTVEGYYSVFKRGMKGVYQHCSEKHLHRYLAEFDFRYSNRAALGVDDYTRAEIAAKGIVGKRLTYRRPDQKVIPFQSA